MKIDTYIAQADLESEHTAHLGQFRIHRHDHPDELRQFHRVWAVKWLDQKDALEGHPRRRFALRFQLYKLGTGVEGKQLRRR